MGTVRYSLPKFDVRTNSISIMPDMIEAIRRDVVDSDLSIYQKKHKVIEFLPLTRDLKYKIHTISGSPLGWQRDTGCDVTARGGMKMRTDEITPVKLRNFMKYCPHAEAYDTIFRGALQWKKNGQIDDSEFLATILPILKEDLVMMSQGLLSVAFLGQLFDYDAIGFSGTATPQEQEDFVAQANIFEGLIKKLINSTVDTMFVPDLLPDGINPVGYSVDISAVASSLLAGSDKELQRLVYKGESRDGRGGTIKPVLLCTSNMIPDIWDKARSLADTAAQNDSILREITVVADGGRLEYFWRGIPIVPMDEFCTYDQYLDSDFYFAALTSSRNIQVGTNYSKFDDIEDTSIGVTYQRVAQNDIKNGDAGSVYRDTHALLGVDIANPRLFTGTYKTY